MMSSWYLLTIFFAGANPNKTACFGKTSLGEAAHIGSFEIAKLLIDATLSTSATNTSTSVVTRKRHKSYKRKYQHGASAQTVVKYKNINDRKIKDCFGLNHHDTIIQDNIKPEKNQGYFVVIHSEGSSSDESKVSSLLTTTSLTPSPQSDLEWDEEIDNDTPVVDTSEDESWTSMYK